jgi:acetylornithine deacetylase
MSLVQRLAEIVAYDTQNPVGQESRLAEKLARDLRAAGAREVVLLETGTHASAYAVFGPGAPEVLLNAHLDTVPANQGYSAPPHLLVERQGRLHGLGTADTKGAIAAILEALSRRHGEALSPPSVAVLFSGDEEKAGTCMRDFLARRASLPGATTLKRAVVCEPTGCKVGSRHRGIAAIEVRAQSPGGHSSLVDEIPSPLARLARVAVALDDVGTAWRHRGPLGFQGLCLNVAALEGGIAFNVIPSEGRLLVSLRPGPGVALEPLLQELEAAARAAASPTPLAWKTITGNPPFATRDVAAFRPLLGTRALHPVDLMFWTEAALLAEAGIDAVVFGPGDIAQAHAADEYVSRADLETALDAFTALLATLA